MKDVRNWIDKTNTTLDSQQNKKKPLRDQHALREKILGDVQIQKTKISLSIEKLQVIIINFNISTISKIVPSIFQLHFRSGIGGDVKITESAGELLRELDELNRTIKEQTNQLETAIQQVEQYQLEVQQLRQQIIQVEQQLRAAMAPTHHHPTNDQAVQEQQVGFFKSCVCVVCVCARVIFY